MLVLEADPIEDAPILDLRLRKGARRHDVRLLEAAQRRSARRRARRRARAAAARRRRGDRDPVARAPDGRPRRRRVRAGAARARGRPVAGRHRRRGPAGNPGSRQRPRAARGGGAAERRPRAERAPRERRRRPARRRAGSPRRWPTGELAALLLLQSDPLEPTRGARCGRRSRHRGGRAAGERALERAATRRRAGHVPDRRPARARERRVPRPGIRREGGHGRPPRRAHPAAATGRRAARAPRARSGR